MKVTWTTTVSCANRDGSSEWRNAGAGKMAIEIS
jgi:hypothetical protein